MTFHSTILTFYHKLDNCYDKPLENLLNKTYITKPFTVIITESDETQISQILLINLEWNKLWNGHMSNQIWARTSPYYFCISTLSLARSVPIFVSNPSHHLSTWFVYGPLTPLRFTIIEKKRLIFLYVPQI